MMGKYMINPGWASRSQDKEMPACAGRGGKAFALALALLITVLGSLLLPSLQAANWYVDNAATGTVHNGTSWASAWTSFSAVVWGSSGVKAGDTLYLSGGATSKTYTETWAVGASGTAALPIRIALDAANHGPQRHGAL